MACAFTKDAENCMRLVQLLRGPGCTALQNVLVQYSTRNYGKPSFEQVLLDPGVEALLKGLVGKGKPLTKGQWFTLYGRHFPQKNVHKLGKPETFDITLTFLLVRNLCGLAPPSVLPGSPPSTRPCWDSEPAPADTSFEANLARIKFYRNHLCHHETGEIPDLEFNAIFDLLKQAIADISTTLNLPPPHWSVTPADLERFRTDPISQDDAEELENLRKDWKQQEKDVLDEVESIKDDLAQQKQQLQNIEQGQKSHGHKQKQYHDGQMGQFKKLHEALAEMKMKEEIDKEEKDKTIQEEIRNVQTELCSDHRIHMGHIQRLPTDEDDTMSLKDVYVKLSVNESVLENNKIESWTLEHYSEAFHIAEKGSHILVEGEPGMGKTTFVKKVTTDWVDVIENTQENVVQELKEFDLVFVVPLGFIGENGSLASILIDQHGLTIEKKNLERILLMHDRILLILDGYDEYTAGTCPQIDAIIQRKLFKKVTLLMTSRPYKTISFSTTRRLFEHQFQIEGFSTLCEIIEYVQRFFQDERKANSFIPNLENAKLRELSKCPLMLLILCLLFEEEEEFLALELHTLYWKLMDWFYQRFLTKGGQCNMSLEEILIRFGKIALQGLLKGQLLFQKSEIEKELGSDIFKIGFLSSTKIRGLTARNISVTFPHKSIQEYVAGFFLAHSSDGWEMLQCIDSNDVYEQLSKVGYAFDLAVQISDTCLLDALRANNPFKGVFFDFYSNYQRKLLDGYSKTDMLQEIHRECTISVNKQWMLSSYFIPYPVVINRINLDSSNPQLCSKPLSLNALTARDIVDESQTILACDQITWNKYFAMGQDPLCFVILTDSLMVTIYYCQPNSIENQVKKKILKCIIGCGLDDLSFLRLIDCDFSMNEIREICQKPKDLKVLSLTGCKNGEGSTLHICKDIVRHTNLRVLILTSNQLDWHLFFSALSLSGLRGLRELGLNNCQIPAKFEPQLVEFISSQKDLASIDFICNLELGNILPKILEILPSICNLVSLCLGPWTLPNHVFKDEIALKAVISGSSNLKELRIWECLYDVSKEIIEKKNLEILDISCNTLWALTLYALAHVKSITGDR